MPMALLPGRRSDSASMFKERPHAARQRTWSSSSKTSMHPLCFGVVLFQQPVFVNNTKAVLQSKWRSWTDSALRDNTISRLAEKHRSGHFYGIARRHLFTHPVQVRARTRNYGDGWIPSPELECRCRVALPAWACADSSLRGHMQQSDI